MAWTYPDYFACAVPVTGYFFEAYCENGLGIERMKNVPLWIAHSSDDFNVTVESDDICAARLRELGVEVKYTRWEKYGHKMSSKFYRTENWADWMFEQSLDKR